MSEANTWKSWLECLSQGEEFSSFGVLLSLVNEEGTERQININSVLYVTAMIERQLSPKLTL